MDGRPMEVTDYATKNDCSIITDSLKKYDPCYSESYRSMHQLSKMPDIEEFIKSPDHCRRTEYTVEFRLCGKPNCDICKKVGRSVRTPNVTVNGHNLRNEMLRFTTLPVPNEDDPDHYLPSAEARKHIEDNNLSAEDLKKHLPTKLNTEAKKAVAEGKAKDKQHDFHATKVRATADCFPCVVQFESFAQRTKLAAQVVRLKRTWKIFSVHWKTMATLVAGKSKVSANCSTQGER